MIACQSLLLGVLIFTIVIILLICSVILFCVDLNWCWFNKFFCKIVLVISALLYSIHIHILSLLLQVDLVICFYYTLNLSSCEIENWLIRFCSFAIMSKSDFWFLIIVFQNLCVSHFQLYYLDDTLH